MDTQSKDLMSRQSGVDGEIKVTFEGKIAIIHMCCGQNRWNVNFVTKMNAALDKVESNVETEVLITTGEGKFYSNGYDIEWITQLNEEQRKAWVNRDTFALVWRMVTFPMPTIAALNGHAFALGAFWSMAHDYIVMNAEKGWWCFNEVHNNFLFPDFYKVLFRELLTFGPTFHKAAIMGYRYTGAELVEAGVAHGAYPAQELLMQAKELGLSLVKRGPYSRESLSQMKTDVYVNIKKEVDKARLICKSNL